MAGRAPRVDYLAGFSCPAGGLAAGTPRVLSLGAEVALSAGGELVYVYEPEGRRLSVSGGRGRARGAGAGGRGARGAGAGGGAGGGGAAPRGR